MCYVLQVLRCDVLKTCDVLGARAECDVRRATGDAGVTVGPSHVARPVAHGTSTSHTARFKQVAP